MRPARLGIATGLGGLFACAPDLGAPVEASTTIDYGETGDPEEAVINDGDGMFGTMTKRLSILALSAALVGCGPAPSPTTAPTPSPIPQPILVAASIPMRRIRGTAASLASPVSVRWGSVRASMVSASRTSAGRASAPSTRRLATTTAPSSTRLARRSRARARRPTAGSAPRASPITLASTPTMTSRSRWTSPSTPDVPPAGIFAPIHVAALLDTAPARRPGDRGVARPPSAVPAPRHGVARPPDGDEGEGEASVDGEAEAPAEV